MARDGSLWNGWKEFNKVFLPELAGRPYPACHAQPARSQNGSGPEPANPGAIIDNRPPSPRSGRVGTDAAHGTPQSCDLQNSAALPKSQTVGAARFEPYLGGETAMSKLRSAGRASYHLCRRQPANLDRLLGRRARHAVRIRAAKPRRSEQNHLYFDPGDGRLITVFTSESWQPDARPNPTGIGNVHHIAFMVSRATYTQAAVRGCRSAALPTRRGRSRSMYSIYFREPLGQLLELACHEVRTAGRENPPPILREGA